MSETSQQSDATERPIAADVVMFVAAIAVLVGLMYYSVVYPYPSGKHLDAASFVVFWFKELILVAIAALGLLLFTVAMLVRLAQRIWLALTRTRVGK